MLHDGYLGGHWAPEDYEYFLCVLPTMIIAVIQMLEDLGVQRDNILLDDFGS